ncbi:hypothetical protein C8R47DRAFT_1135101 [Mycena vitilis]|nr:hypothetical protein C8R47DRAFT_1135101 [Mycena vitilis]
MDSDEASFLRVQVWGLFLESLTFGVYLVTCASCYRVFFTTTSRQRGLSKINWPMLAIFFVFLAKTTSSLAIHLYLNLQMVTVASQAEAAGKFMDGRPINMAKYITVPLQSVIASGFFIYRCWLVHHRAWLITALPLVLWLGSVATMGIFIHFDGVLKIGGLFAASQTRVFGSCFWGVTFACNLLTSGLIVYRICRVDHLKSQSNYQTDSDQSTPPAANKSSVCIISGKPHHTIQRATHIAIESGLIYTTLTAITFGLFVANSNAVYVAIYALVQVIGISFNVVIIHNRPRPETSSLAQLNSVPLQFTSSNMSVPASAIEFAYPKQFTPRRKNWPASEAVQEDSNSLTQSTGISQNHSQQSIQSLQ